MADILRTIGYQGSKFPAEFTAEELTEWLNHLDTETSYAIIEKLYKDMRDYSFRMTKTLAQKT